MSARKNRLLQTHIANNLQPVVNDLESDDILDNLQPGETVTVSNVSSGGQVNVISHVTRVPQQGPLPFAAKPAPAVERTCPIPAEPKKRRRRTAKTADDVVITPTHERIERQATDEEKTARQLLKPMKYDSHSRTLIKELLLVGRLVRVRKNAYVRPRKPA